MDGGRQGRRKRRARREGGREEHRREGRKGGEKEGMWWQRKSSVYTNIRTFTRKQTFT